MRALVICDTRTESFREHLVNFSNVAKFARVGQDYDTRTAHKRSCSIASACLLIHNSEGCACFQSTKRTSKSKMLYLENV
jgi:hypothetical protein